MFNSLSQRAWLITIVPALTGIVFAFLTGFSYLQLDSFIRTEARNSQSLANAMRLISEYRHMFEAGVHSLIGKKKESLTLELDELRPRLQRFNEMAKGDRELTECLKSVNSLHREFEVMAREADQRGLDFKSSENLQKQLYNAGTHLYKGFGPLFTVLHDRSRAAEAHENELVGTVGYLVAIGLVLNILTSVMLVYSFSRRAVARVDALHVSAQALSEDRPIVPRLSGDDEVKRLETKLIELSKELERAGQRKQDFLAMIGHDLRSPLTSLEMMLDMFDSGVYGELPDEKRRQFHRHSRNLQALVNFISDLLELEKIEAGSFVLSKTKTDLIDLLNAVTENSSILARELNKQVELADTEGSIIVYADRDRLEAALSRMVFACVLETPGPVRMRCENSGKAEVFVVIESPIGHGLVSGNVFDRFQVSDEGRVLFAGHRHSLSLARKLIRLHGGEIDFQAQPNLVRFRISMNRSGAGGQA